MKYEMISLQSVDIFRSDAAKYNVFPKQRTLQAAIRLTSRIALMSRIAERNGRLRQDVECNFYISRCALGPGHGAVTTEGKLFTFGTNNGKGTLGLGEKNGKNQHRITEVPALKGVNIATVDCGYDTLLCLPSNNRNRRSALFLM